MKVDLIKKYKWYIFGTIAVVLIMSIGLSFCAWDNNSILNSIDGIIADYGNLPTWTSKTVGEDFADNNGLRWLIVDKGTVDNKTTMVLMTYYVTEQRVYEVSNKICDYNSTANNIRTYLNNTWYQTIDNEIKRFVVLKRTAYQPGTIFNTTGISPEVSTLEPATLNYAWLPGENEIGFTINNYYDSGNYVHDSKFSYFPAVVTTGETLGIGENPLRIARTITGDAVDWWTRTGKMSHAATLVSDKGGVNVYENHWIRESNWLRPCVQVQF